jgi:hypothetical protein
VWFKASREAFAFEASLLEILGPLAPDLLPEVIAARPERGWLLLADAGARAREEPIDWAPLLRRYAELQLAAVSEVGRMLAAGVPDRRSVAADIVALLPALEPETAAALEPRLAEIERAVDAVLRLRTLIRAVNDQRVAPYDARWSRHVENGVAAFLAGQ